MAIVPMTDAVNGAVASADAYNKLIDNIEDLDTRLIVFEDNGFAKYRQTTSQTGIPGLTWRAVNFQTADVVDDPVSQTGYDLFTISKPGVWYVLAQAATGASNTPIGTKNLMISSNAATSGNGNDFGTIYAINSGYAGTANQGMYVQTGTFLKVATSMTVAANVYSYGGSLDLTAGGNPNIQFTYIG